MQQGTGTRRVCARLYSTYLWQSGDTLENVARREGVTEQSIRNANTDVNFATIQAGDAICIPPESMSCDIGTPYTVQSGDTITSIAAAYGITARQLLSYNPGQSEDLLVGQILCVPSAMTGGGSTPPQTTPPQTTPPQTTPPQTTPPQTRPPVTAACPIGYEARTVRQGQTYADLLIDNNVSYSAMRGSNPFLNPAQLVAGARYCTPPSGTRQLCNRYATYRMQEGEVLADAARRYRTTIGRLLMLNPNMLPTDFTEGAVICVPVLQ